MRWWSTAKWLVLLTLLSMVFIRLVWMNLRVYSIQVDPRVFTAFQELEEAGVSCSQEKLPISANLLSKGRSEGKLESLTSWQTSILYRFYLSLSCKNGQFSIQTYLRNNQTLLLSTIFFCLLIVRIFCRSWLFLLIVAAILLSRGRLISSIELLSGFNLSMFLISFWALSLFHFLRSGSLFSFALSNITLTLLVELEPVYFILFSVTPLMMFAGYIFRFPVVALAMLRVRLDRSRARRLRGQERYDGIEPFSGRRQLYRGIKTLIIGQKELVEEPTEKYQASMFRRIRLFKPLRVPFSLWAYHRHRWLIFGLSQIIYTLLIGLIFFWFYKENRFEILDYHNRMIFSWLKFVGNQFDVDIIIGLLVLIFVLAMKPIEGLLSFWEAVWFFLSSYFLLLLACFFIDYWNATVSVLGALQFWRGPLVVLWMEPVFLTMALLCLYHTVVVIDRRVFG